MLVLSRNEGEGVTFPDLDLEVKLLKIGGNRVQIGIEANPKIRALRSELAPKFDSKERTPQNLDGYDVNRLSSSKGQNKSSSVLNRDYASGLNESNGKKLSKKNSNSSVDQNVERVHQLILQAQHQVAAAKQLLDSGDWKRAQDSLSQISTLPPFVNAVFEPAKHYATSAPQLHDLQPFLALCDSVT